MTIQVKVSGKQTPISGKIKTVVPKSAKPMITRKYHTASADLNREHKSTAAPPRATSGSNSKEGGRNTPDYSKLKKPDIKGLLEKRGIHGGKVNKSKLIELLQKDDAEQAKRDGTPEDYANQTVVQLKQQHRAIGLPFKANARKAELIKALEGVDAPQKSDSQDTIRVKRDETPEDYANQTVAQLKERYKARGLRTFPLKANTKKAKLIKALEDADAVELQKSDSQDTTKVKRDGTPKDYANQTVAQLKERYKARGLRTFPLKANTKKAELIKALEDADTSEVSSKGEVVEALKQDEPLPRTQNLSIPIRSPEDTIQAQPTGRKSTTTRKIHHQIGSAVQGLQVDVDQYSILPKSYKVFVRPATQFNPDIIYDAQLIPTDRDDKSTKFYHLQVLEDKLKNSYVTLIRQEHIGEKCSVSYFDGNSLKAAVSKFEKWFQEKTGLKWDDKDKSPMNNRYHFIQHERALDQVTKDQTSKGEHINFKRPSESQDECSEYNNDDSNSNYCAECDGDGSDYES